MLPLFRAAGVLSRPRRLAGTTCAKNLGKKAASLWLAGKRLASLGVRFDTRDGVLQLLYGNKAATWKLGLYWATNRRFSSCSEKIARGIDPNEHTEHPGVRETIRYCSLDSVKLACEEPIRDSIARRQWDSIENLEAAIERAISEVEQPEVRSTLPEDSSFRCVINYIGAYAYWDLPTEEIKVTQDTESVENHAVKDQELPVIDRENDPPVASVWH